MPNNLLGITEILKISVPLTVPGTRALEISVPLSGPRDRAHGTGAASSTTTAAAT